MEEYKEYQFTCPRCGSHRILKLEHGVFSYPVVCSSDGVCSDEDRWDNDPRGVGEPRTIGFKCEDCSWDIPAKDDKELIAYLEEHGTVLTDDEEDSE